MSAQGQLSPRLEDIRFSYAMIGPGAPADWLEPVAFKALMCLVSVCAAGLVWTYTPPGDGSLPDDDVKLARITRLRPLAWRRIRPELEPFFAIRGGRWHLREAWIAVDERPVRYAIPLVIRDEVLTREGRVCTYCGATDGPFDHDHILPVSRGGSNDPSNLTLACVSCNRSKGARTLREWMLSR